MTDLAVNMKTDEKADDKEHMIEQKIVEAHESVSDINNQAVDDKKLVRKIDLRLIPWISFLYCLAYLDRSSIGNARLYGLETDLHITDTQFLICLSIFFVPYALLEVPANICLKHIRPSVWLSSIMTIWGVVMTTQGFVRNFGGLITTRFMLGFFEAGLYPGFAFYLSCWYKRREFGIRAAIFTSINTMSAGSNGLLAAAISHMNGLAGKNTWQWIFILNGMATIILGLLSFYMLTDYPGTARFLSEAERERVASRLYEDLRDSPEEEHFNWAEVKKSFRDWKTWLGILSLMGAAGPAFSFSLFLPTIISELGFGSANRSNLLTTPVFVLALISACSVGYLADRTGKRGIFAIFLPTIAMVGYTILLVSKNSTVSYFAVYLVGAGVYPNSPNNVVWLSNNVDGALKRSISVAIMLSAVNLTGIISTNIYRAADAPSYKLGHSVSLGYLVLGSVSAAITHFLLQRENSRRDRGERDEIIIGQEGGFAVNGTYMSVEEARKDKGDMWSGFRYIT